MDGDGSTATRIGGSQCRGRAADVALLITGDQECNPRTPLFEEVRARRDVRRDLALVLWIDLARDRRQLIPWPLIDFHIGCLTRLLHELSPRKQDCMTVVYGGASFLARWLAATWTGGVLRGADRPAFDDDLAPLFDLLRRSAGSAWRVERTASAEAGRLSREPGEFRPWWLDPTFGAPEQARFALHPRPFVLTCAADDDPLVLRRECARRLWTRTVRAVDDADSSAKEPT